ncbi:copper resistance CopC family protein [Micromonospora sp. WMMD1155]|uniref:copper resistance CopC family protein n=1 Tax=Micromonospora sp. WMMD1155 TaxID=3016094 RepID=UPI00249CA438|nr:copper resistance CopC family protein [Micromonospora sp. WMMD1155]WFE53133.1 copper resistance protein CopC [Micromonospora sp. WMMD1155]
MKRADWSSVVTAPSFRPTVVRLGAAVLALVVALLIPASPAWAHNTLRSAAPVQESTLASAPTEIVLEFVERLDPTFTTIVLTDAAKRKIPTGDPVVGGAKGSVQLTGALPNGTYTVAYRVVSTDGHPVQGSYPFTVADPNSSAAPIVSTPTDAAPAASSVEPGGGPNVGILVAGAVLAVLVVVGAGLLWRRARRQ